MLGNIKNKESYLNNIVDWSTFNGIFSNKKIRIGDGDGMVERCGHLLLIEVKSPGKEIPLGQSIMFRNLSQAGTATCIVLWGRNNVYTKMRVYTANGKQKEYEDIDNEFVITVLQQWERWAIRNSKV